LIPRDELVAAGRIAAGLWQAGEAIRVLIDQAERSGLPEPTAVRSRLTWAILKRLSLDTQRYAEHVVDWSRQQKSSSLLVVRATDLAAILRATPPPAGGGGG
jgi:hypothetical protein